MAKPRRPEVRGGVPALPGAVDRRALGRSSRTSPRPRACLSSAVSRGSSDCPSATGGYSIFFWRKSSVSNSASPVSGSSFVWRRTITNSARVSKASAVSRRAKLRRVADPGQTKGADLQALSVLVPRYRKESFLTSRRHQRPNPLALDARRNSALVTRSLAVPQSGRGLLRA